jgi:AraC-like DNA-binding protein
VGENLERAETIASLASEPRGKYFVGRTWLSFFARHGGFSGTMVWGEPSADDVHAWEAFADLRLSPLCAPHATLFDASRVGLLGPSAFGVLAKYAAKRTSGLGERITRLGIVHRGSFAGAVAAGFTKLVPVPFPVEVFTDVDAALEWLGCAQDAPLLAELARVHDELASTAPIVRQLGAYLRDHLDATPVSAARALAVSTRSLQRRLAENRTTFRRELDAARVREAQRLLLAPETSITEAALRVGLTSPQHLSTLFRRCGFESPSTWRARAFR